MPPPLARQAFGANDIITATYGSDNRPVSAGASGQSSDAVRLDDYQIAAMSIYKLKTGTLGVSEILTVGDPAGARTNIDGTYGVNVYNATPTHQARLGNITGLAGVTGTQWGLWTVNGYFTGTITAAAGTIGGWTIGATSLTASNVLLSASATGPGLALGSGVNSEFVGNGVLAQLIVATGQIILRAGTYSVGALVKGIHWDGTNLVWKATNSSLDASGNLTATGGTIGGFTLGADYVRDAADSMGMASTVSGGDDVRFWAGGAFANRATTSTYRVFESGIMHLGSNAATYLELDGPNVRLRSSDYVSGVTGWNIQPTFAEFANAYIRGEMHSTIFVKDLIEAHAGSMMIGKSAGKLNVAVAVPGSGTWEIIVGDPPGGGFLFANSDICRMKAEYASGVAEVWFVVSARADVGDGTQSYTCTYSSGTRSITYAAGTPILDYGASGQGYLFMSSDLANAPYYDVRTHAGAPWTTETLKARLGLLTGCNHPVTGSPLTGIYGLWTDSGYFTGTIVATSGTIGGWTLGATTLTGGTLVLDAAGFISTGATPALTGTIRFPNNSAQIYARNSINAADIALIALASDDTIALGAKTRIGPLAGGYYQLYCGAFYPGGQTTRYISDDGTYTVISGGLKLGASLYPGNQTTLYLAASGTSYLYSQGNFQVNGALYTTGNFYPGTGAASQILDYLTDDGIGTLVYTTSTDATNNSTNFSLQCVLNKGMIYSMTRNQAGGSYNVGWSLYCPTSSTEFRIYSGADQLKLTTAGALYLNASGDGSATVTLFDKHDDALMLRRGFSERQMETLEEIGVMEKREEGGWWMKMQPMTALLAGGIYQTRQRVDDNHTYVMALERRIAELEARLS